MNKLTKLIYNIAIKVITEIGISEVVPFENFYKAEDLLKRAYRLYLTSNREESEEAYIEGLSNMAKLFIEEQRIERIFNKIFFEVSGKEE